MEKHPIENIMSLTMESLNKMIDVDKVIGSAVMTPSGATVIPVSQIGFGFVSGGGEYELTENKSDDFPFLSASSAGISVKPSGFLIISGDNVRFLPIQKNNSYDKIIDLVPQIMEQIKNFSKDDTELN